MASVNKVILVGNLGKDPVVRGNDIANFSVATSERWKDKGGEMQEKTEWVNVVAFSKLGEICAKYLKKGSQVYIEGRLQTRKWQDKDGQDRYSTEVVANVMQMLGGGLPKATENKTKDASKPAGKFDDFEDDIPF